MKREIERRRRIRGQSILEFALILPLLLLLIVNAVNFGVFMFAWITVSSAARSGAQYLMRAGASAGAPQAPDPSSQVIPLVTADCASLLNKASLQVRVCTNNNSTVINYYW